MASSLIDHQQDLYAAVFYGSLIVFALGEFLLPRVRSRHGVGARWSTNFVLMAASFLLGRFVLPIGGIAFALYVASRGWGLMHLVALPLWLTLPAGILLLDLSTYWVHRLSHVVPLLWRAHVVHHADLDVDFTTGFRHHPFESLITAAAQLATILLLGIGPVAVLLYDMLATASAFYTHANIRLHPALDRLLRLIIVTRDAHVVHHSARRAETDSNFSQVFLFWDRLFGTYCKAPADGLDGMTEGLEYFREPRDLVIDRTLTMPFRVPRLAQGAQQPEHTRTAPPSA